MLKIHQPYPKYEHAIFVGDRLVEFASALSIHPIAMIGGDIPCIEQLHPYEKQLECTSCAMRDRRKILDVAAKKNEVDYILLEDNGLELNPATMAASLIKEGFRVFSIDVKGSFTQTINNLADFFHEEREAKRVIDDYFFRIEQLNKKPKLTPKTVLTLLGIRHPVTLEAFVYAVSDKSYFQKEILSAFGTSTLSPKENPILDGVSLISNEEIVLLAERAQAIIACGDTLAVTEKVLSNKITKPILPIPFYTAALEPRKAKTMQLAFEALSLL